MGGQAVPAPADAGGSGQTDYAVGRKDNHIMKVNVVNENGVCRIGIDGEMTIYSATQTKKELLSAMAACNEIEMNLAGFLPAVFGDVLGEIALGV